jgi:hypothetical protein
MNLTQADRDLAAGIAAAHPIEGEQQKSLVQLWREMSAEDRKMAVREMNAGMREQMREGDAA